MLPALLRAFRARFGGDGVRERLLVEAGAPPRDVRVVDFVGDAEVAKGAEEAALDALDEVAAVDEVLAAEGEQVAAVGALGGGGEAEQELRARSGR